MSHNINQLLEDISIRHACKNIGTYAAELEQSLDIKLKLDGQQYEYCYAAKFDRLLDAVRKKRFILAKARRLKMFSVEDVDVDYGSLVLQLSSSSILRMHYDRH